MKTQRIFLLLMLVVLVFALASCGNAKAPDCFDIEEEAIFTDVTEYEGKYLAIDDKAGLIALATNELDSDGTFKRITKVLDITDGNRVVFEMAETQAADDVTAYNVIDIEYPVIKIEKHVSSTIEDGNPVNKYDYEYYLIQKEGEPVQLDSKLDVSEDMDGLSVSNKGSVYIVKAADTLYWVNKDFEIIGTFPRVVADTYSNSFDIMAENGGYLYAWDSNVMNPTAAVLIYDKNGVCTVKYTFTPGTVCAIDTSSNPTDSVINPGVYVLNNGNVLIQECVKIEDGDTEKKADFIYDMTAATESKIDLVTKIIDQKTGEITEIDCNFLVKTLESNYSELDGVAGSFPFKLTDKYANQAYILPIVDGILGKTCEYVVLSDDLKIEYTLSNAYLAISGAYAGNIKEANKDGYIANAYIDGVNCTAKFDWAGNVKFKEPINLIDYAGDYYYTNSGVYDMKGKMVFDIENSMFASNIIMPNPDYDPTQPDGPDNEEDIVTSNVTSLGDYIYLRRYNYATEAIETYRLDAKKGTTTLIADGVDTEARIEGDYLEVVDNVKCLYNIYNTDNELVLVLPITDRNQNSEKTFDNAYVIYIELNDGGYKTFVFGDVADTEK